MPKRSKKSKSKRMTLKHKYKVIKKVKQHHKKAAKEAKKAGNGKKKALKDPGIPSAWPFKAELIQELQDKRQQILAMEKARKEERKRQREEEANGDAEMGDGQAVERMQADAAARGAVFDASKKRRTGGGGGDDAGGEKEGSRRAFYKEFVRVVEASDVILQVLDARDPLACRCAEVERFVRAADPNKKVVLLLNKIDLVPREVAAAWLKYLREEAPTIAFKASTQRQAARLGQRRLPADGDAGGSECLGAEALLQLLKNYARSADKKVSITVGVVGMPNVGKSSLINSLKRARVAAVGNAPGVTRTVQAVNLDKHVKLLDSPGIVFAAADGDATAAALRNAVRVEQVQDPVAPVAAIVARCPARQLMQAYAVPAFDGPEQFLAHVAQARGKLKKGGALDLPAAARQVLQDWHDGRLRYYTLPPARDSEVAGSAAVVPGWGVDFDADKKFAAAASAVIEGLPSLDDDPTAFFQTQSGGPVAVGLDAMAADEAGGEGAGAGAGEEGVGGMSGSDAGTSGDEMDEGEAQRAAARGKGGAANRSHEQNARLYSEAGQYNPHAARAEKKRRAREKKAAAAAGGAPAADGGSGSDYEFDTWSDAKEQGADVYGVLAGSGGESGGEEAGSGDGEAAMSGSDVE